MFDNLRADLRQATIVNVGARGWRRHIRVLFQPGTIAVLSFRFSHWVTTIRVPLLRHLLLLISGVLRAMVLVLTGVHISPKAQIGPGFVVHTAYGVFIPPIKIGANFVVQSGVHIGSGTRGIGDNVFFCAGAKVIGNPLIGDNVLVMPNSLVLNNIPKNLTVVGVPARIRLPRLRPMWFEMKLANNNATRETGDDLSSACQLESQESRK